MIDKEIAKKQTSRMARMSKFPWTEESLRELVSAVQAAETEEIAAAAVSSFIDYATTETPCPMPFEVRRAIYERQSVNGSASERRTASCKACMGIGYVLVERSGMTGAKLCECRKVAVRR